MPKSLKIVLNIGIYNFGSIVFICENVDACWYLIIIFLLGCCCNKQPNNQVKLLLKCYCVLYEDQVIMFKTLVYPAEVIDTVIGDPLFTVPFGVEIPQQHLCYEIRGIKDMYFNFISDSCVSVNAHYAERILASESTPLHVMDEIAIRAVNNAKQCTNILIDRTNCTTSVDNSVINAAYDVSGIRVIPRGNTVVITVPNCNDTDLEMEIECEEGDRLRFEVTRGINLREESHGLVGK